jgi:hypothetical protein
MPSPFHIISEAVGAAARFVASHPVTCGIGLAAYLGTAVASAHYLPAVLSSGWTLAHLATWGASLPQIVLLAPVWAALLRFVIVNDTRRNYFNWDRRVLRVLWVSAVLSAIAMAGWLPQTVLLDLLGRSSHGRLVAYAARAIGIGAKLATVWVIIRLAIAPALAAAGTRTYVLDTAFAFTKGWIGTIFGVKLIIYLISYLPALAWMGLGRLLPDRQEIPISLMTMLVTTALVTAVTDFVDAAAMARITQYIVRARTVTEEEDKEMEI